MKNCRTCHEPKPLEDYPKRAGASDGYRSACKVCQNAKAAASRKSDPERINGTQKKWREANPEKAAENQKRWRDANPERAAERQKKWRQANPEKVAESQRRWREGNPGWNTAHAARWREANTEVLRDRAKLGAQARAKESGATATNLHKKWTDAELAEVIRDDISLMEISKLLGRTYGSVSVKRNSLFERQRRLELIESMRRGHGAP